MFGNKGHLHPYNYAAGYHSSTAGENTNTQNIAIYINQSLSTTILPNLTYQIRGQFSYRVSELYLWTFCPELFPSHLKLTD